MKKATHRKQALMIAIFLLAFTLSLFSFGTTPAAAGDVAGVSTHLFLTVLRDYDHDAAFSVTYTDALGTHTKPYHAGMEVTAWSPVTITCTNHHVYDWSIDADVQEATIVGVGGITGGVCSRGGISRTVSSSAAVGGAVGPGGSVGGVIALGQGIGVGLGNDGGVIHGGSFAVAGDGDGGAACKARSVSSDGGKGDADGITGAAGTGQIGQCIEINLGEACLIIAGVRIGQRLPAFC